MKKGRTPIEQLSSLLDALPAEQRLALTSQMQERAPEIAKALRAHSRDINHLIKLSGRELQRLYPTIPQRVWIIALKTAEPELKTHLLMQLSTRAQLDLEDALRAQGPVRLSEVLKAQEQVMIEAEKLAKEGKIHSLYATDDDRWIP